MKGEQAMPIVNGKYKNPQWVDKQRPAIDAGELNAISDTLEKLDIGGGNAALVTLPASKWSSKSQTVTVQGVSAVEGAQLITPVPTASSQAVYYDAGIRLTAQAANSLTFTANTTPTTNLSVYVVVQEVG